MDGEQLGMIGIAAGLLGLGIAFLLYNKVNSIKIENETVAKITAQIQDGAMAFLYAEYRLLSGFIVLVAILLLLGGDDNGLGMETMIAFIIGALCSVAAGFSGMRSATSANGRTAQAAADGGQSAALTTSYNGGAVMGLAVGGLGLAGISLMYYLTQTEFLTVENIAGFGMGASSIALFARVGGGIYTKAADVGADLVGKVEAGIPEDDFFAMHVKHIGLKIWNATSGQFNHVEIPEYKGVIDNIRASPDGRFLVVVARSRRRADRRRGRSAAAPFALGFRRRRRRVELFI